MQVQKNLTASRLYQSGLSLIQGLDEQDVKKKEESVSDSQRLFGAGPELGLPQYGHHDYLSATSSARKLLRSLNAVASEEAASDPGSLLPSTSDPGPTIELPSAENPVVYARKLRNEVRSVSATAKCKMTLFIVCSWSF